MISKAFPQWNEPLHENLGLWLKEIRVRDCELLSLKKVFREMLKAITAVGSKVNKDNPWGLNWLMLNRRLWQQIITYGIMDKTDVDGESKQYN
jgi:hypothetical protein